MSKRSAYRKAPQENIACCPCIKVKTADIDGLEEEAENRKSYDQKNIDSERSSLNLRVHGLDKNGKPIINHKKFDIRLKDRIFSRIDAVGAVVRHDKPKEGDNTLEGKKSFVPKGYNTKESVVAEGIEFQLSHTLAMRLLEQDGLLDEDGRIRKNAELTLDMLTYQYFEDMYKFACVKYGENNVVGGYIHLDEYTPHMHIFVVPITMKERVYKGKKIVDKDGKPKMKGCLDAKNIFGRTTIKQLWQDFGERMKKYGAEKAKGIVPKGEYDKVASIEGMARTAARLDDEIGKLTTENQTLQTKITENITTIFTQENTISENSATICDQDEQLTYYEQQLELYQEIGTSIENRQEQLRALNSYGLKKLMEGIPNMIKEDVQNLVKKTWRGELVLFEEFDDIVDGIPQKFIRLHMQNGNTKYEIEVQESNGHVRKDGKWVQYKDSTAEVYMTQLASYFRQELLPETKEFVRSYYKVEAKQKEKVVWTCNIGAKNCRIVQAPEGVCHLQRQEWNTTKVDEKGRYCEPIWIKAKEFTYFKEIARDTHNAYLEIKQTNGKIEYVDQYGNNLTNKELNRLGINSGYSSGIKR